MGMTKQAAARIKAQKIAELGEDGYREMMRQRAANRTQESYLRGAAKGTATKIKKNKNHFSDIAKGQRKNG